MSVNKINKKNKIMENKKHSNLRIMIACIGVVMVWRSIWDFCDMFIFPDNKILSDIICLVIGLAIVYCDDGEIDELH